MTKTLKAKIKRLKVLKEKRDAVNDEISEIEDECAKEIRAEERKQKDKKYRLIGKVIQYLLQQEITIIIRNEQDLINLLDKELKTKTNRTVFGLKPLKPIPKKQPEKTLEISQENLLEAE